METGQKYWLDTTQYADLTSLFESFAPEAFDQAVADPDLGGWGVLIYLPCRFFSLLSFLLFLPKIRGAGPLGPSPRSATVTTISWHPETEINVPTP